MRFEIVVLFLVKVVLSTAYEPDGEEITPSGDVGASDPTRSPPPPIDTLGATRTTLALVQQLLDASNETTMAATSSMPASTVIEYAQYEYAEAETTTAAEITTSLYTNIDYVSEAPTTKAPPQRSSIARWQPSRTTTTPRTRGDVMRTKKHSVSYFLAPHTTISTTTDTTDSVSTTQDDEYYEIEIVRADTIDNATDATDSKPKEKYDNETIPGAGKIISKCYVCGLEDEGIPGDAHCSDAFAVDFLPMSPVDPLSRLHLADYRKYCRFSQDGEGQVCAGGRSVLGAWTGGCSVRWIDLSGVYTQRACRRREKPIMGRHYVSKRMAKLEKALRKTDAGCIASPAATLVPFSRSVSLYARVHVCVCVENWCNHAARTLTPHLACLLPALAYYVAHS